MSRLSAVIPELAALESRTQLVRIPPELDVPLTPRLQRLIDTAPFRRLARISQLGLVRLVYPAATHTRFEHSLGVYHTALLYLQRLQHDPRFVQIVNAHAAEIFLVSALLHDIGHWPFCHPVEDMELAQIPAHESLAAATLQEETLSSILHQDWSIDHKEVAQVLSGHPTTDQERIVCSMLSGPIDVDKMDYLARDSLHAGVPYGRNFDRQRLIGSLCLNERGDGLAISDKGRTAAEMMVFARYVMFSEVYWHHAVRSATVMFQRAFHLISESVNLDELLCLDECHFIEAMRSAAVGGPAAEILERLFGPIRRLYKRWGQFSLFQQPELHARLARQPFERLVAYAQRLVECLRRECDVPIQPHQLLIDAPPPGREVEFLVDVYDPKEMRYCPLHTVSPVARTLAERQFDDYVKRVRVFVDPDLMPHLTGISNLPELLRQVLEYSL